MFEAFFWKMSSPERKVREVVRAFEWLYGASVLTSLDVLLLIKAFLGEEPPQIHPHIKIVLTGDKRFVMSLLTDTNLGYAFYVMDSLKRFHERFLNFTPVMVVMVNGSYEPLRGTCKDKGIHYLESSSFESGADIVMHIERNF